MTRNEYLGALREELRSLPVQEQEDALRYYEEYFDDAGPENEQQVIAELGSPEALARNIIQNSVFSLARAPQPEEQEEPKREGGFRQMGPSAQSKPGKGAAFWILVVLSSVICLPLLLRLPRCLLPPLVLRHTLIVISRSAQSVRLVKQLCLQRLPGRREIPAVLPG